MATVLVAAGVGIVILLAVRSIVRQKKTGQCASCDGCTKCQHQKT